MEKQKVIPHDVFMKNFQELLSNALSSDDIVSDLPSNITTNELDSLAGVEEGRMLCITINNIDTIVATTATVAQLKTAFKHSFNLHLQRSKSPKHISWKHVWKRYYLCYNGHKLIDDHSPISQYEIIGNCAVGFLPRLKERFYGRKNFPRRN